MFDSREHPHRRLNALTGEYVLVSPHRMKRPWQGKQEALPDVTRPQHDPQCYLCAGNTRANGEKNPHYSQTFVFDNDFAALLPDVPPLVDLEHHELFKIESVRGTARVLCFSPRHDWTLPDMPIEDIHHVVDVWADQTQELGETYPWVQVFENKGEIMGCSNPHPHGQIWAETVLPNEARKEHSQQQAYYEKHGRVLLLDYIERELTEQTRVVADNEDWAVVVPFWAVWPFETLLVPKSHVLRMPDLSANQRYNLARILKEHLTIYDNVFGVSFPYSMGWHGAPYTQDTNKHWQLHAHFYPPLLRSATVKKFMVGYEMLGESQRDLTAEQAAARLREVKNAL